MAKDITSTFYNHTSTDYRNTSLYTLYSYYLTSVYYMLNYDYCFFYITVFTEEILTTKEKRKKPELSPEKYRAQMDRQRKTGYALPSLAERKKKRRRARKNRFR